MHIWLDDVRKPPEDDDTRWIWVTNAEDLMRLIAQCGLHAITQISFDNDLGYNKMEGYQALDSIEQMVAVARLRKVPALAVHSGNPVARTRMNIVIDRIYTMAAQETFF
jgi:hypothetical protein